MEDSEDLSDFDKGQIVMARQLGQSISQTAELVGCSQSAVVSIYKKWSKDGQPLNRQQCHGRLEVIPARAEQRVARSGRSHGKATTKQIADNLNASFDEQQSENALLRGILTPVHCQERLHWAHERQNWTMEQWKKVAWSGESRFLLHHVDGRVHVLRLPGEEMAQECTMERSQGSRGSVTLWAIFCWETLGACVHVDVNLTGTTYLTSLRTMCTPS
ncbi:hypothetical protein EXN66_Car014356 [Channa argus]|uniref:Transposable element Tc1 transposase n=1 Tax=Channa argus TaxID=215402 RepID=A0A6G1Q8D1_CHAAH|nr:hypothetical protein EXN66_Car014356 [Channa argus]